LIGFIGYLEVISKNLFRFWFAILAFPFRGAKIVKLGPRPSNSDNFLTRPSTETVFQNGKIALKNFF
jgi:hypothetical protein